MAKEGFEYTIRAVDESKQGLDSAQQQASAAGEKITGALSTPFEQATAQADAYREAIARLSEDAAQQAGKAQAQAVKGAAGAAGDMFGVGSPLAGMGRIVRGGGAALAVGMAADVFEKIAVNTEKWVRAVRQGEMAWIDVEGAMFQSLPVIGDIWRGCDAIGRAIWPIGEDLNEQIKAQMELSDQLEFQRDLAVAVSDEERERLKIQQEYEQTLQRIAEVEKERAGKTGEQAGTARYAAEQQRRFAEEIRQGRLAALGAAEPETDTRGIDQMIAALEEQYAALTMSSEELLAYRLGLKDATDQEIELAESIQVRIEQEKARQSQEKQAEAIDQQRERTIEDIIDRLEQEADTYGMSAREIALYRLEQEGATKAQKGFAASLADTIDQLEEANEQLEEAERRGKNFADAMDRLRHEEQRSQRMRLQQELVGKSPAEQKYALGQAALGAEEAARRGHGTTPAQAAEQYKIAQDLWDRILTGYSEYLGEEEEEKVREHYRMTTREVERAAYAGTDRARFPVRPEAAAVSQAGRGRAIEVQNFDRTRGAGGADRGADLDLAQRLVSATEAVAKELGLTVKHMESSKDSAGKLAEQVKGLADNLQRTSETLYRADRAAAATAATM